MTRRRSLTGAASAAVVAPVAFVGCGPVQSDLLAQSRVLSAEDELAGDEAWYATACRQCPAGCGVLVRVVEGRAKKVEGNPDHPLNRGKLCARGQAAVQEQYHPDRLRGPLVRAGERGHGRLVATTWETALEEVAGRLRTLREQGRAGDVVVVTPALQGLEALLVERFCGTYGAQWLALESAGDAPLRAAVRRLFGTDTLPHFDLANARFVVSFGADFLGTWLSPVHYGAAYGVFRHGSYRPGSVESPGARPRGYLVQVEPRFSTTAASADEWVPVRPGREAALALSVAQVLLAEGLADPDAARAFGDPAALDAYRPERAAAETGVAAERIRRLAREFAARRPSLALVGGVATAQTNGADVAAAVLALNALVGAVGAPGGVLPNPPPAGALPAARRAAGLADWQRLAARLREGGVPAVLVYRADPVHGVPASVGLADALARAPFIASFSSFPDDTTALADVALPSHLPLEDWGALAPDPAPGAAVVTVQQPVVQPLHDTRGFGDTLLALATKLGGAVREALPWDTAQDALRETARALQRLDRGSVRAADAERFWVQLLQRGGWWDESFRGTAAPAAAAAAALREGAARAAPAQFAGAASDYPYYLVAFPHHTLGAGEGAHLPWLQATPDPTTSVVWKTWVEVNPKLGQRLGVREGDIVRLESLRGSIDLPVYIHPAAPPDVLSVPLGQGHAASGRWAAGRGANPLDVLAPLADGASGGLAYAATRVRLAKTGRRIRLPKLEGDVPAYQLPGQPIIKITRHER